MPLTYSFLARLLICIAVALTAVALLGTGTAPFVALGLVDASTSLPLFLLGSFIWGPRGLGVRYYGLDMSKVRMPSASFRHGLALVALGLVLLGHFTSDPRVASFGFLAGLFATEAQFTTVEYRRHFATARASAQESI